LIKSVFITASAFLALSGGFLVLRNSPVKDWFYPKQFRAIVDGKLYVSGQISSRLIRDTLTSRGICRVDSLTADPSDSDEKAEVDTCAQLGIPRSIYLVNGNGTGNINAYADALTDAVAACRQNKPILVHCYSGAERSGAFVAFYRILIQHAPPDTIVPEMKAYRWDPAKNPKLIPYIDDHLAELGAILVQRGVIASVPSPLPHLSP